MARWFRHYAGMMSDPKFGGVARRCGNVAGNRRVSRSDVLFVWGCILESAAEKNSAEFEWDADAVADLLDTDTSIAQIIHDELEKSGLIEKGRISKWDERQFVSDSSTERSRKHRATLQQRCATPPETETETYTDTEKKKVEAREEVRASPKSEPIPSKANVLKLRGTRWPADAVVPDSWLEDGETCRQQAGHPQIDLRSEAMKFANYWASKSGGAATKVDWKRTWLNWCLQARGTSNVTRFGAKSQLEQLAEIVAGERSGAVIDG